MEVTDTLSLQVSDQSQISESRRHILSLAANSGLNQDAQDRIALVMTELGTNLIKHAGKSGRLLAQILNGDNSHGVEVFSVDTGPGMDTARCMVDGFTTSKSLGHGLGTAKRISDEFDIYSEQGVGSIISVRFWNKGGNANQFASGGLSIPLAGEIVSGDKWQICQTETGMYCLLVDGLGHGFEACEASNLAVRTFEKNLQLSPSEILKIMHALLRGSRGAVAAVAKVDRSKGKLTYCGLGNITGLLLNGYQSKHLTSLNGSLGYEARKFVEFDFPWTKDSLLLMHSDGVSMSAWKDLGDVTKRSCPLIAAWAYHLFGKKTDDAAVLVVKGV